MNEIKNWMRLVVFDLTEGIREMSRNVQALRYRHREDRLNFLLDQIDVTCFPERFLIALLIATAPAALQLKARDSLIARIKAKLINNHNEEIATEMLMGL